jgi:DNA polymerase I-like protein with 3'-5' exonuclease and polymerase domains
LLAGAAERLSDDEMATCSAQVETIGCPPAKAVALAPDPTAPRVVRDRKTLEEIAGLVGAAAEVAIDLETSGLDSRLGEIVGIGLAIGDDLNFYVPVAHRAPETKLLRPDQLSLHAVVQALHFDRLPLIAHNAKFELRRLCFHAGVTCHFVWDTMIAARLLASHLPADLKVVAARELDVPDWSLSKADMARMQFLPVDQVARYCAKDCRYTLDLYRRQKACLV